MSDNREDQLNLLREVHTFPTRFLFKAIGPNSADFMAQVLQAVIVIAGKKANAQVNSKESAKGSYLSVSVEVEVGTAEMVLEIYAALRQIKGVRHLM